MWKRKTDFNRFITQIEDLAFVKKYSKRETSLFGIEFPDLTYLPYEVLKNTIPDLINSQEYEKIIHEVVKYKNKSVKLQHVKKLDNYTKLKFFFHIEDCYKAIAELEQQYLVTPPDPKMVNAGIRDLDILGDFNLIDNLVKDWEGAYTHKEIREMPYSMIFDKQLKMTIEAKISKNLSKKK